MTPPLLENIEQGFFFSFVFTSSSVVLQYFHVERRSNHDGNDVSFQGRSFPYLASDYYSGKQPLNRAVFL